MTTTAIRWERVGMLIVDGIAYRRGPGDVDIVPEKKARHLIAQGRAVAAEGEDVRVLDKEDDGTRYVCPYCGAQYKTRLWYNRHVRECERGLEAEVEEPEDDTQTNQTI